MLKLKTKDQNIFFSGDLHINHSNICKATSNWPDTHNTRDFRSIGDMNNQILGNINYYVKENDILILPGDLLFRWKRAKDYINLFENLIRCKNIYVMFGNHDHPERMNEAMDSCYSVKYMGDVLFLQIDDRKVFISHYAHRVWPESHHGSFHIFAHSHGSLEGSGKSMDVGVDAAYNEYNEYRPYNWTEVKDKLDKKAIHGPDHHNNKTT